MQKKSHLALRIGSIQKKSTLTDIGDNDYVSLEDGALRSHVREVALRSEPLLRLSWSI